MPQSLGKVIFHIIFSTKNRELWLDSNVRPRTHAYLATICRDLSAELVNIGSVADHSRAPANQDTAQNHPGLCWNFFGVESPA